MPDSCVIHLRCRSGAEGTIFYSIGRSVAMTKTFQKVCTVSVFHFESEFSVYFVCWAAQLNFYIIRKKWGEKLLQKINSQHIFYTIFAFVETDGEE